MLFLFYTRSLCARWSGGLLCLKSRFSLCPSRPLSVLCARALSLNSALRFVFLFIFEITNQKKDIFFIFQKSNYFLFFCLACRSMRKVTIKACVWLYGATTYRIGNHSDFFLETLLLLLSCVFWSLLRCAEIAFRGVTWSECDLIM